MELREVLTKKPGRCVQYGEDQVESHVFRVNVILEQVFKSARITSTAL